jgi:hypothetical protein
MELSISAVPSLINDLNNDVYPKMALNHEKAKSSNKNTKELDQYVLLLRHMYNGQNNK